MTGGENHHLIDLVQDLTGKHINIADIFDIITKCIDANSVFLIGRVDLDNIAPHPEGTPFRTHIVPGIMDINQFMKYFKTIKLLSLFDQYHHVPIVFRGTNTINAGDTGNDNHVPPGHHRS